MSSIEEWRPVVGYENLYEVSNLGRLKSLQLYDISQATISEINTGKTWSYVTGRKRLTSQEK